jgi:HAD superfamily hydrolase (TIGR01484 family)
MRYQALACDYDGTLARDGHVTDETLAALEKLRASGRKTILVTGRELEDLLTVFPALHYFDRAVVENGALVYHPELKETRTLAEGPPQKFIEELRRRNVAPISVGRVIVATWKPHENVVLDTIRDLGLELQVIFNKEAVMVLPAGINKATGLRLALQELELSPHEVVGIGDAENDHAFLAMCECGAAVSNALPTVKERADIVTRHSHGRGVEDLIADILATDLRDTRLTRHDLLLGHRESGAEVKIASYGTNLLIAGPSGSGKSTVSKSVLERIQDCQFQYCIVDPEGDYDGLDGAVTIGDSKRGPTIDEAMQLLKKPNVNVVVNMVGLAITDRPPFFLALMPRLQELRARTGRPHWLVIDETHHLLPADWVPGFSALPSEPNRMVFITVHPELIAKPALAPVNLVLAVGAEPEKTIGQFCEVVEIETPKREASDQNVAADSEGILAWFRQENVPLMVVKVVPTRGEHRRHIRKYAEGELPPDRCFYFRGPAEKLNLQAQNLIAFNQIAAGVDDETWLHHLKLHDYSSWFREKIKDDKMATEAEEIEKQSDVPADKSREAIRALIERYYTVPEAPPMPMPGTAAE